MPKYDSALLVFAKAPIPGQAKTRLIPALGGIGAAELHARLVRHTLKSAVAANIGPVALWCAPDTTHSFFVKCVHEFGVHLQVQQGADLGQRMAHALAFGLHSARHVLLIGTDCPTLTPDALCEATRRLQEECAVVFIPTEDGGYALVGVRDMVPAIFDGIAWGSKTVMAQTRLSLLAQSTRWQELAIQADIDIPQDLQRLQHTHPNLLQGIINPEVAS